MTITTANNAEAEPIPLRYVAFCDVLGFSHAVENRFDETIAVYKQFMQRIKEWPFPEKAQISVYSDSILIVCEELAPILHAVQSLWFATLTQDWMIRGAITYGKYWESKDDGNLFVVSDALVRAVRMESTIRIPAIAVSNEIDIPVSAWASRFAHGQFATPLLHFRGWNIVNPFNAYWFASARMRVSQLWQRYPAHKEKYRWFLDLCDSVEQDDTLVPDSALPELLRLRIIKDRSLKIGAADDDG